MLEAVCWDRDRFGKDYLGGFDVVVEDIFANSQTVQEVSRLEAATDLSADFQSLVGIYWSQGEKENKRGAQRYLARSSCNFRLWTLKIRPHVRAKSFKSSLRYSL